MTKTIAPTRAELCEERDKLNLERVLAEAAVSVLLAARRDAEDERDEFEKAHVPLSSTTPIRHYSEADDRKHLAYGGVPSYHQEQEPSPERIAVAEQDMRDAVNAWENISARVRETPDDDVEGNAAKAGARFIAGRAFDWGVKHFYQGCPVLPADLPGINGRRLNALVRARTLVDLNPFGNLESNN